MSMDRMGGEKLYTIIAIIVCFEEENKNPPPPFAIETRMQI